MSAETSVQDDRLRTLLESRPRATPSSLKKPAALVSQMTPRRFRPPARTIATRVVRPLSLRRLAALVNELRSAGQEVLLHLGCGPRPKAGYINIDLVGARIDVALDLARGLPLPDGSVDGVFHEHVLEHLPTRVGYGFLRECRRVLRPGGVLRVVVPDAGACIDSYSGKISSAWADSEPVKIMAIEKLFYEHQHVAMYDEEKLTALMRVAGFREVARRDYGESALSPVPDTEKRRGGSLYVEGTA